MKLFRVPFMSMRKTLEVTIFAKKVLRKFLYWNREKVKKVSVLWGCNVLWALQIGHQ